MANLIACTIDEAIVKILKMRASKHGVSSEAEHCKILEQVLLKPQKNLFLKS